MVVQQIYQLTNDVVGEVLGDSALLQEDLSNLVDVGTAVFNANAVDNYVKSLVNHIGKLVFVNRPYKGNVPSVLMDSWEFGSVLEKVSGTLYDAEENESWDLTDGQTYNQDIFYKPTVSVKFYNSKKTFEIPMSFTERQLKESFSSASQMNSFLSMLMNDVEKSLTVKVDALIQRTINNMIAETVYDDYKETQGGVEVLGDITAKSGVKAINLLYLYNETFNTSLTVDDAIVDKEFIRFAALQIKLYVSRISKISKLFNIGGQPRFTPNDLLHLVMLEDFKAAADVYLQSDTFHDEYTTLPNADSVPYWQGSGLTYGFTDVSTIDIDKTSENHDVTVTGVLAVLWDRDALGVANPDRRVTTHYNAKAEFFNNYYKHDASYFNDFNENMIVFFIA